MVATDATASHSPNTIRNLPDLNANEMKGVDPAKKGHGRSRETFAKRRGIPRLIDFAKDESHCFFS